MRTTTHINLQLNTTSGGVSNKMFYFGKFKSMYSTSGHNLLPILFLNSYQ